MPAFSCEKVKDINMRRLLIAAIAISAMAVFSRAQRWHISPDETTIVWAVTDSLPHRDHLEMSGEKISSVLRYGVNADKSFSLERSMVWPMLRTVPENTHASLMRRLGLDFVQAILADRRHPGAEKVDSITFNGILSVYSTYPKGLKLRRDIFPSTTTARLLELYTFSNDGTETIELVLPSQYFEYSTPEGQGTKGAYRITARSENSSDILTNLRPGDSVKYNFMIEGLGRDEKAATLTAANELAARERLCDMLRGNLILETPDPVIDTEFAMSKIRACESIFRTAAGLLHSPGGESYYAAIWANDQAEYANPFFPYTGYDKAIESVWNSFRLFSDYMNDEYKPIPSSIINEGRSYWNGAGDRGDAAMIAYGASRAALVQGDIEQARDTWPLIEWCLEYCKRHLNDAGVVESDCDELEFRFPAGKANLCTSTLYYDALISASHLARELGKKELSKDYAARAAKLHRDINAYFGATVQGYDTYRYYEGNDLLRSWICIPLVAGIYEKAPGTIDALLSPELRFNDGLLSQSGTSTYWDRSTLYALRGIFAAGEHGRGYEFLEDYSGKRLLGEHVPYPIEAWPEGNQRHLSAESALYCRIVTEGIFGIRPTGLHSFDLTPQMPDQWNHMTLRNVYIGSGKPVDIAVTRSGRNLRVDISREGKKIQSKSIANGRTLKVRL